MSHYYSIWNAIIGMNSSPLDTVTWTVAIVLWNVCLSADNQENSVLFGALLYAYSMLASFYVNLTHFNAM